TSIFLREENRPRSVFDFAMNTSINDGDSMPQWCVQGNRGAEESQPFVFSEKVGFGMQMFGEVRCGCLLRMKLV
ncbi:MAG: hypothetical protein AB7L09_26820, partial [Nitrospira sp.]